MKSEIKMSDIYFFRNQPPGLSSRKVMESPEDNRRVCITFAILFLEENMTYLNFWTFYVLMFNSEF